MKRFLLLALALILAIGADAKPKQTKELDLRIGTYNIWSHVARRGASPARSWDNSKQAVADLIVDLNCDIIGMQEVTGVCRDDLAELVKKSGGKKYKLWWVDTYPGPRKNVGNAVFYNKKKFTFSQQNIYYFSPTPEEPSRGWDEKKFIRAALTAVVTHKKTGKKFFFIATHGPLAKKANAEAGRLLVEFDKKYNTEGLPTIVVGDMNARPTSVCYKTMLTHYEDCYLVAEKKSGTVGTFNGAPGKSIDNSRRIDHIYVHSTDKGTFKVKSYEVNLDKLNCGGEKHYPADHNPVIVNMTLK